MTSDPSNWARRVPLVLLLLGGAAHLVALLSLFGPLALMAVGGHPALTVFFWVLFLGMGVMIAIMGYTLARVAGWTARWALPTRYEALSVGRGMALAAGALAWLFWTFYNLRILTLGLGHAPSPRLGPSLLLIPAFGAAYGATIGLTTLAALWRQLR